MRAIELNDNIGEFDYTKPAKRGDVTMFVWNALITDRWAVSSSNDKDGLTYTYSDTTQLEMFFEGYKFLDNEYVTNVAGCEKEIMICTKIGYFYIKEKTPLYAVGGNVTALVHEDSLELIGATFDEDYPDMEVISGPIFYLEKEGYNLSRARKKVSLGNGSNSNYAYILKDKKTDEIIRVVYLKGLADIYINSIKEEKIEDSDETLIILNDETPIISMYFGLYEEGFAKQLSKVKKGDIITNFGAGLYVVANKKLTGELIKYNASNGRITIDSDEYIVADECICSFYKQNELIPFDDLSSKEIKEYIGTEITVTLNVAEEVCKIDFGKTDADNQKYKVGFVTNAYYRAEEDIQSIRVDYGEDKTRQIEIKISDKSYFEVGDMVSVDDKEVCKLIDKDTKFDNDISVKYNYDAKKISYPMIGEYIVTTKTKYYKVNMEYQNNSITKIKSCNVERLNIDEDIGDLAAYKLILVYNEDMEVIKVYALNEINKFENQIALIRDFKTYKKDGKETYKATLTYLEDGTNQSDDMNKTIEGRFNIIDTNNTVDIEGTVTGYTKGDFVQINSEEKESVEEEQELKEEVPVLGGNLKKIGYIHEVKSAISEFIGKQYIKARLRLPSSNEFQYLIVIFLVLIIVTFLLFMLQIYQDLPDAPREFSYKKGEKPSWRREIPLMG